MLPPYGGNTVSAVFPSVWSSLYVLSQPPVTYVHVHTCVHVHILLLCIYLLYM